MFTLSTILLIEGFAQETQEAGIPIWVWILLGLVLAAIILGLLLGSRSSTREENVVRPSTDTDTRTTLPQSGTTVEEVPVLESTETGARVYPAEEVPQVETGAAPVMTEPVTAEPAAVETTESVVNTEDLAIIEGIGPGIKNILNDAGILTFEQLANMSSEDLRQILRRSGLRVNNPDTWPEQARLASLGQWDALKEYQDRLNAGRQV